MEAHPRASCTILLTRSRSEAGARSIEALGKNASRLGCPSLRPAGPPEGALFVKGGHLPWQTGLP